MYSTKIHWSLGFALVTALGFASGSASANDPPGAEPIGEAALAISYSCTMSGPPGERADALLTLLPGGKCRRDRTGIPGNVTTPSCHQVANFVGCFLVN